VILYYTSGTAADHLDLRRAGGFWPLILFVLTLPII
jgi:hypothetical protein